RLDATTNGTIGHSANLGVPRWALDLVGGFDETLGAGARFRGGEDQDLFDRLFAAGHAGWYEPRARAWHEQWRSRWDLVGLEYRYGLGTGARLAKLTRTDRVRARAVAAEALWHNGLRLVPRDLRNRYELGAVYFLARAAGIVWGFPQTRLLPVTRGHLVTRD